MITVALLKPKHPANLGFIARCMKNFDLTDLILIEPECCVQDQEAIKTSKHALNILENAKI